MDLKVRVGKNQFMIWMAFLQNGSDWLCPKAGSETVQGTGEVADHDFGHQRSSEEM